MFALASPIEGQSMGTTRQGSTAVSVCSALKAWAQLLQGIQVLHMLSIPAITVRLCLGVSLPRTFPCSAHPQAGLERGAHGKPSWGEEKICPRVLGCWRAFVELPGYAACSAAQSLHGYLQLCFPSPARAGTCRCWHVTHGSAGQGMKCTQCTKSQPCPQGKDRHKNKGKQKHRTLRP